MKKQKKKTVVLFEKSQVRRVWVEKEEKWYFSVVDVVAALTNSVNARAGDPKQANGLLG